MSIHRFSRLVGRVSNGVTSLYAVFATVVVFSTSSVGAQTNLETNAGIQFNFSTPGAGNLALGGAFLALADDATTAYTNPAGLTNILDPEVHIELRGWEYTHIFTDRGRIDVDPSTGMRIESTDHGVDNTDGLVDGRESNGVAGTSFFSVVYPFPQKGVALALYRHELVNFEANFSTQGAFLELARARSPFGIPGGPGDGRLASVRSSMDLEIINHGLAAAYRISDANLSIGLSLSFYEFVLGSVAERFVPPIFEESTFEPDELVNFQTQEGDDSDVAATIGLFWEGQMVKFGAVYRQSPSFDLGFRSDEGPALTEFGINFQNIQDNTKFHVPESWGIGIGLEPGDSIRLAFDFIHIKYSDQLQDFTDIFGISMLFPNVDVDPELDQFRINDADEFHLGIEYFFTGKPISVRTGAWYDPDHSLHFSDEGENVAFKAIFRKRPDEIHYTAGIGISLPKVHVDLGFDYSERISIGSLSATYRF